MSEQRHLSDRRFVGSPSDEEIQTSLRACVKEGVAAQVMIGIFDYYLTPYALFLNASTADIGMLVAIPNLFGSVAQLFSVKAVHWAGDRLRLLLTSTWVQLLFLLPVGFLIYAPSKWRLPLLILLITVFRTIGSLIGPAWGSLVSEYLPPNRRGHFMGWRSRWVSIAGLAGVAFWGLFLFYWKQFGSQAVGFIILFLGAVASRSLSLRYMSRMANLPMHKDEESEFTLWMFLRRFRESNFVKFVFYVATVTFATQLTAPYFSVHMLRDLKFNYVAYMSVHMASIVTGLLSFPIWGRHADHVGNAKILKVTSFALPVIPLLWLVARQPVILVLVEMMSGFVWGGFTLCATNFIYDAVSPSKRVRCLSYFNLINGAAVCLGALSGGYLAEHVPPYFGLPLGALFLISAGARFLADFLLARHFEEVRAETIPVSSSQLFFSVIGVQTFLGRNEELRPVPLAKDVNFGTHAPGSDRRHAKK